MLAQKSRPVPPACCLLVRTCTHAQTRTNTHWHFKTDDGTSLSSLLGFHFHKYMTHTTFCPLSIYCFVWTTISMLFLCVEFCLFSFLFFVNLLVCLEWLHLVSSGMKGTRSCDVIIGRAYVMVGILYHLFRVSTFFPKKILLLTCISAIYTTWPKVCRHPNITPISRIVKRDSSRQITRFRCSRVQ